MKIYTVTTRAFPCGGADSVVLRQNSYAPSFRRRGVARQMCAQTVREALQKVAGVQQVKVNLSQKKATVIYCQAKLWEISSDQEIQIQSLMKALEPTGYRAKPILTVKSS